MRGSVLVVCLLLCVAAAVVASPARAAKKRGRAEALRVAVLPFEGRGAGGSDVKDALELELELVEDAAVVSSAALEKDLAKLDPDEPLAPATLAALMKKRGVDIVVRGARGPGERAADALVVAAYASDGKPHWMKELPLGSEPDVAAAAVSAPLRNALADWRSQRVVRLPSGPDDDGGVDPSDVLADDDEDPPRDAGKKGKKDKDGSALDFNEPTDDAEEPAPRRSRLDEDTPPADDRPTRRATVDDEGRKIEEDVEEVDETNDDAPAAPRIGHMLAVSAFFRGATWQYRYDGAVDVGNGPEPVKAEVAVPFFPGGGARVDFWPMQWLGIEGEGGVGAIRLVLTRPDNGPDIAPAEFVAYQIAAATAVKLRYVLQAGLPGLGIGARVGYRYWGGTTETQTLQPGGAQVTIVPGFAFHSLVTGAELDVPLTVAERRLEIELRADLLGINRYEEAPDNPGASSLALGWSVSLMGRFELISGLFAEAGVHTAGVGISFEGAPEKPRQILLNGDQTIPLAGGAVVNATVGFDLGVGFMF